MGGCASKPKVLHTSSHKAPSAPVETQPQTAAVSQGSQEFPEPNPEHTSELAPAPKDETNNEGAESKPVAEPVVIKEEDQTPEKDAEQKLKALVEENKKEDKQTKAAPANAVEKTGKAGKMSPEQ